MSISRVAPTASLGSELRSVCSESNLSALSPGALPHLPGLVPDINRRAEFSTSMIVLPLEWTLLKGCTTQTFSPVTAE